jgi:GNAT superfamily N-acetyltransferase
MRRTSVNWTVTPFDSKLHDRSSFSCGATELDRYLRNFASQDVRRDVSRVFVATAAGEKVLGYHSLSAASFRRDDLLAEHSKRLPRYPVPAALLGRLAVDKSVTGQGLGAHLLMDALERVRLASETLAVHAVIVDALDDGAAAFYRRFGYIMFPQADRRLFLPMATIRRLAR